MCLFVCEGESWTGGGVGDGADFLKEVRGDLHKAGAAAYEFGLNPAERR
jgi:hypothetical protein